MSPSTLIFAVLLISGPLAGAPDDLENSFQNLKQAEGKKDPAEVKRLAVETCALARKAISAPAPADVEEKKAWSSHVAYARDIQTRAEYALYATAVQAPAATTVDLISTLEQQNPKSKYLDDGYTRYFMALSQTGGAAKIPAIAEKAIAHFPENEDLLLVLTDTAMNRKQSDRSLNYANRLVAVLSKHPKPEGMPAADWERKKTLALGRGHWIAGMIYSEKTQYYQADKSLRSALPFIKGNDAMLAPALYYLGVANYQLGKMTMSKALMLDAVKFSQQAAAYDGPYAQPARHNALVMRDEASKMR